MSAWCVRKKWTTNQKSGLVGFAIEFMISIVSRTGQPKILKETKGINGDALHAMANQMKFHPLIHVGVAKS